MEIKNIKETKMAENTENEKKELAEVYQYTNYKKKVYINTAIVTVILLVVMILIYIASEQIINVTMINSMDDWIGEKVDESVVEMRNFLHNFAGKHNLSEEARKEMYSYIISGRVGQEFIDKDKITYVCVIIKLLIYFTALIVGIIMSIYIRGNFDTMLMNYGTGQKKIAAAGIQESLLMEKKEAMRMAGITLSKEQWEIEKKKIDLDIRKERERLRIAQKRAKLQIQKVNGG